MNAPARHSPRACSPDCCAVVILEICFCHASGSSGCAASLVKFGRKRNQYLSKI